MDGVEITVVVTASINAITLGTVILNNYRVGKLDGLIRNGAGFIKCPFYRGHVEEAVKKDN